MCQFMTLIREIRKLIANEKGWPHSIAYFPGFEIDTMDIFVKISETKLYALDNFVNNCQGREKVTFQE